MGLFLLPIMGKGILILAAPVHTGYRDPPPHASGWVLVQLVFQSVGSFLVGGDDWGGLSFPYWVFLPPA